MPRMFCIVRNWRSFLFIRAVKLAIKFDIMKSERPAFNATCNFTVIINAPKSYKFFISLSPLPASKCL